MENFITYIMVGLANGCIYSLIAIGFVLIYKSSGIFNFAQGGIVILCAYIFYIVSMKLGLPLLVAIIAALAFGAEMYFWTNMLVRDRRAVRASDFGETYPAGHINGQRYREIADENWEQMRDFAWWSGGVLLIIALDSYVGAHLFDFDNDPVPVPDRWDDTFGPVGQSVSGTDQGPSLVVFQWQKRF